MAGFREVKARLTKVPGKLLMLEPWVFADDWEGKPKTPVCVGLRLMADLDKSKARAAAEKLALELHPRGGVNALDAFNDTLVRQCAALGICSPNDVEKPSEILPVAEDQVGTALTSRGARFIFDAIHRYEVETSPIALEATDEDLIELSRAIDGGGLAGLAVEAQATTRRFLMYALEELRAVTESDEPRSHGRAAP